MVCPNCGAESAQGATYCSRCGSSLTPPVAQPPFAGVPPAVGPPGPSMAGTITFAVFSSVCCGCLPIGAVALYYAIDAQIKSTRGDTVRAQDSEERAKRWARSSIIVGVIVGVIGAVIRFSIMSNQASYYR